MANLNVTYEDLNRVAGVIDGGRDALNQQISDLSRAVDELIAGGFQTDAASGAYNEQFDTYVTNTTNAIESLTGFAEFLRSAATSLQETDTSLSNAIRGQA
ncbi:WXG100 family type VII secretion target [Nocardioides sp. J2M5]|uniref:WXG100 family type VII secretion target n=1 Tax=Nocardioides palaemonis TaxID=2829810 RepID=UPI001BA77B13|nr:WXG100 family type VII secretion target [Nocardioides palaemonis]MBS2939452.1 WXG100 family type VII secretion target [Nocardioides palaemonis]